MIACKIGPDRNADHAHGGGMDCVSKIFGTENFWVAILLISIATDRLQDGPPKKKPNDGHAQSGGMDWLPKIFGAEHSWMAILLILIKN